MREATIVTCYVLFLLAAFILMYGAMVFRVG